MTPEQEAAERAAVELIHRPLSRAQRRQVERAAGAAAVLARQLQRRATSRRGRGR